MAHKKTEKSAHFAKITMLRKTDIRAENSNTSASRAARGFPIKKEERDCRKYFGNSTLLTIAPLTSWRAGTRKTESGYELNSIAINSRNK